MKANYAKFICDYDLNFCSYYIAIHCDSPFGRASRLASIAINFVIVICTKAIALCQAIFYHGLANLTRYNAMPRKTSINITLTAKLIRCNDILWQSKHIKISSAIAKIKKKVINVSYKKYIKMEIIVNGRRLPDGRVSAIVSMLANGWPVEDYMFTDLLPA